MRNHTDLINYIAQKINAKSYLEIGVFNPQHNFDKIKCEDKTGVDPENIFVDKEGYYLTKMSSDDFFKLQLKYDIKYDLIFIDGLHHADQVKKDIINSWNCLKEGGVIVIHDCNPHSERITHEPRDNGEWCGGVYKTVCQFKCIKITLDFDYGCCVIRKIKAWDELLWYDIDVSWLYFDKHRKDLLSLVSVEEGLKIISEWQTKLVTTN